MENNVKIGLEIHQQLNTTKLFCSCPSEILDREPDFTIKRHLKASSGEQGSIDNAALQEVKKDKEFIYQGYNENSCLVETDEEPPHNMNQDALKTTLEIANALNATVVDNIIVMRKIVLDGSNTSGFQRTALVGINGSINVDNQEITIPAICLEEDAAKIVKRTPEYDVYNLSRLGIPLIEISTEPVITSGKMCKKVAQYIGMVLRSSKHIKRGLGTIRQDVNVSIPKGNRVEIKGAQNLRIMDKIVDFEVQRQKELLKIKNEIKNIKFNKEQKIINLTYLLKNTNSTIVKTSLKNKGKVLGILIPQFKGLIGREIQPDKRLGTELSDYSKVKSGVTGLFHSDELPKYGITIEEVNNIRKALKCKENDAFIIITSEEAQAKKALNAVWERLLMCFNGVPKEVRKVNLDGTTTYLRPISGSSRMYPETDVKPINPNLKEIESLTLLSDKANELTKKFKLSKDLSNLAVKSKKYSFILNMIDKFKKIKPAFIAETILSSEKKIKSEFNKTITIKDENIVDILNFLDKGVISKDSVLFILSNTDKNSVKEILNKHSLELIDKKELEKTIKTIINEHQNASFGELMGILMKKFKGKVSGKDVSNLLTKLIKKC